MRTIAFVTCEKLPDLDPGDRLAAALLREHGVRVVPAVWDSPHMAWGDLDAMVVRSAWDYYAKYAAFTRWISRIESLRIPIWNPPALLRWNSDKRYLRDLAARGVPTTPSLWLERGSEDTLADVMERTGWSEVVVKPTVSANGWRTWRASRSGATYRQNDFRQMLAEGGVVVQRFVEEIRSEGEWSFVFLGGAFSHAVLKRPDGGDFRVQLEYGGAATSVTAPAELVTQAENVFAAVGLPWLYARVDGCVVDGRLQLVELEMLEPSLFLELDSHAPQRFAAAILEVLRREPFVTPSPALAPTVYVRNQVAA
ncbi:MAG: ATP-grasp domain-containing protein [Gemmatimonadaceae bacterium]